MAARTAITVQAIQRNKSASLTMATPDSVNGNSFSNDGATVLVVQNTDSSSHTCTVHSVACSHGRTGDIAEVVAAGELHEIGPFDPAIWNQTDGTVQVDWTASTGMKVAARRMA
jgi:hypothetical protein